MPFALRFGHYDLADIRLTALVNNIDRCPVVYIESIYTGCNYLHCHYFEILVAVRTTLAF